MPTQAEKAARFLALHQSTEPFAIGNPWDAGSARILTGLGFRALSTTSAGLAFTLGRTDGTASVSRAYGLQVAGQLELTYPGWDTPSHRALVQLCKDGSYQLFTDDPQDERGRTVFRSVDRAVFKACVEVVRWKDAA